MSKQYDVIVIGAGSGGLNIAGFMNRAGFKVLLIDKKDASIGGDCLNFGCVPSKALIHAAKIIYQAKKSKEFGFEIKGYLDMKKVKEYIKNKQSVIRKHENANYFRKKGMDVILGEAKFDGFNHVKIGREVCIGKKIVIATGSRPRELKISGVAKVRYLTNENIFELEKLPLKFVVIGGGPIGIEMAQAFSRLGSDVTILEKGNKFLPKEDKEIASILYQQFEKEGIKVKFNSSPIRFNSSNELIVKNEKGKEEKIIFDEILFSIGRELNIENLDLEKAGIKVADGKIIRDDYLRTTNKEVYLCGDVAGSYQFTHAAELHASVIINNFFSPFKKKLDNSKLSWVTYTDPEIATFGLNASELNEKGILYNKLESGFEEEDRAIVDDSTSGKLIIYLDRNEKILGGSMIARNAGEIAQELILAMSSGLPIKNLFNKIYPYPTASRINKRIISGYMARKLTERTKKILKFLYGKF